MLQIKQQPDIKPPRNNLFMFQTYEALKYSLQIFDTQNNESMNNLIV